MPCYSPPLTSREIAEYRDQAYRRKDYATWYSFLTKTDLEAMLCDVITDHELDGLINMDTQRVYEMHRKKEGK